MSVRSRRLASVVMALVVALPLLITALDNDQVTATAPPASGSTTTVDPDTTTTDPDDTTTSTPDDPDDTSTTDPDDTTTTEPDGTTTTTTTEPDPSPTGSTPVTARPRPITTAVAAVGALVPDTVGALSTSIINTTSTAHSLTITIELGGATFHEVPDRCVRSELTATCTVDAGPGTSVIDLAVMVDAGASEVLVTIRTSGYSGVPTITAVLPTSSSGLSVAFSGQGALDVALAGNTLASCIDAATNGAVSCAQARGGSAPGFLTNDEWAMVEVRADNRGVGMSSSASLTGFEAGEVSHALLIWGASNPSGPPAGADTMRLAAASAAAPTATADYTNVTADRTHSVDGGWQSVADVTALVNAAGPGTYWGADVAAQLSGVDAWAGWALAVVYESPGDRRVVVLDGIQDLDSLRVSMPASGASVSPTVGIVAWDGDLGVTGDRLTIEHGSNKVELASTTNPGDDIANSTRTRAGVATPGSPSHANSLGVDIDVFEPATSINGNSVRIVGATTTDDVLLGLLVAIFER